MSILRDLISNMKTSNIVEQMRILADQILEEESKEMKYINYRPQGANIFLSLEVPGSVKNEVGFLALERETEDLWIASFWILPLRSIKDEKSPRKKKVHAIKDHRPEKILTEYAKLLKFYNGE
jgi:hypothetical protein